MKKVQQVFTKGVNRRINRQQSAPDRLHTLQNARITKRGDTLAVSRIEGFEEWPIAPEEVLAIIAKPASFNTIDYQTDTRLRFVDEIENIVDFYNFEGNVENKSAVVTGENFVVRKITLLNFTEGVTTGDRLPRNPKVLSLLQFTDGLQTSDLQDNINFTNFIQLNFVEEVVTKDTPLCG
jgi:hypothetical protein